MKIRPLHILFCFLFTLVSAAQEEHAWVYFSDKANVEEALAAPTSILTQRALDRKQRYNIAVDARDVPVNEDYIATIKSQNTVTIRAKSKWLNCIHVIGSRSQIEDLIDLDFVSRIDFAAHELNSLKSTEIQRLYSKFGIVQDFDYGFALEQLELSNIDLLHQNNLTGEDLVIAVLDAGFPNVETMTSFERMRNAGKLLGGYDFHNRSDDFNNPELNDHGTLVLSTISGYVDGNYAGSAPDASFYLFRTEVAATETPVEESYWVEAAERADSLGVDIINSSLSYYNFDDPRYDHLPSEMDGSTTFVSRGAALATEKGMLVVVSAGNNGDNANYSGVGAPADANVLTIGAVTVNGQYVDFSAKGPTADGRIKPDVMAPGRSIVAIDESDQLVRISGTSFSAPIMAGAIASYWQGKRDLDNLEIKNKIREISSFFNNPNNRFGYGIPDFSIENSEQSNTTGDFSFYPNPVDDILNFRLPFQGEVRVYIFDQIGRLILQKSTTERKIDISGFSRGFYIAKFEGENFESNAIIIKN